MANAIENEGDWISLMDYATQYGVSLSTLRRHIKASKIPFRVENGRYLLKPLVHPELTPQRPIPSARSQSLHSASSSASTASPNSEDLQLRLRRAQEEISELKMLVALYEEQISSLVGPSSREPAKTR